MSKPYGEELNRFYEALLTMETVGECHMLFEDLCTVKELQAMALRLEVARLLAQGKNYNEICELTGVSTATISRVSKCLAYGSGGYKLALGRTEEGK